MNASETVKIDMGEISALPPKTALAEALAHDLADLAVDAGFRDTAKSARAAADEIDAYQREVEQQVGIVEYAMKHSGLNDFVAKLDLLSTLAEEFCGKITTVYNLAEALRNGASGEVEDAAREIWRGIGTAHYYASKLSAKADMLSVSVRS